MFKDGSVGPFADDSSGDNLQSRRRQTGIIMGWRWRSADRAIGRICEHFRLDVKMIAAFLDLIYKDL